MLKDLQPADWYTAAHMDQPFGSERLFPPRSQQSRIETSRLRWSMENGEFNKLLIGETVQVKVNYFKALSDRVVDIICQSPTPDRDLDKQAILAVRSYLRDSTPIVWTDPQDGKLYVLDARFWYRLADDLGNIVGWVYFIPLGGAGSIRAGLEKFDSSGRAFVRIWLNGLLTESLYEYNGSSVGAVVQEYRAVPSEDTLVLPEDHGQSVFDLIYPPVLTISRRYTFANDSLDVADTALVGEQQLASPEIPIPPDGGALTEEVTDTSDHIRSLRVQNVEGRKVVSGLDPNVAKLEVLQHMAQTPQSLSMVDFMREEIETLTGMPNVFSDDGGFTMATSGVALRQLNIPLYARMRKIQNLVHEAMNESLQKAGRPTFAWQDAFTVLESNSGARLAEVDRDG